MGAYIINVPDTVDTIIYVNIGDVYDGKTYIASQRVEDLTPYTEPDLEQVRKEAYADGYKEGRDAKFRRLTGSEYQRGLNDAWEAARTLWNTPNRKEIFGHTAFLTALTTLTAQETIEKIRQYEQEQEEQIQVGDEVATKSGINGICTNVSNLEIGEISLVFNDGSCGVHKLRNIEGKTGRHFPEIAEVLAKMKETNNG